MDYKTLKQKQDKVPYHLYILSKSFDKFMFLTKSCLRNWYKYKISCCDTVEQILAQGKTSTIGIKSLSGNDKNQSYLVQVFPEI